MLKFTQFGNFQRSLRKNQRFIFPSLRIFSIAFISSQIKCKEHITQTNSNKHYN